MEAKRKALESIVSKPAPAPGACQPTEKHTVQQHTPECIFVDAKAAKAHPP
jgi:hypothetical protein